MSAKCLGATARSHSPHPSQAHLAGTGQSIPTPLAALSRAPAPASSAPFRADTGVRFPAASTGFLSSGTQPPSVRQPGSKVNRPCYLGAGGHLGRATPPSSSANEDNHSSHGSRLGKRSARRPAHATAPWAPTCRQDRHCLRESRARPRTRGDRRRLPDLGHIRFVQLLQLQLGGL